MNQDWLVEPINLVLRDDYDEILEALRYLVVEIEKPSGPNKNVPAALRIAKKYLQPCKICSLVGLDSNHQTRASCKTY